MINNYTNLPSNFFAALHKLDFFSVVERISTLTVSETGKSLALKLLPSTDPDTIRIQLQKVSEAKEMLVAEGNVPLSCFKNIIEPLKKISIENQVLSIAELLDIATTIRASRSLKSFLSKRTTLYPLLSKYHEYLIADKIVELNINEAIDEQGFVKDNASMELREIRRAMISANDLLRRKLERILKQISKQDFTQEEIITTRDGRLVIPVKAEYKNNVPGFIHSSSASGATVYIEPAESLEHNNALRELQIREQREIYRILSILTEQVRTIREPLEQSLTTLTQLDVLFALGRYSIEIIGMAPTVSSIPHVKLQNARHPILLKHLTREKVVPLTVELGGESYTIIITGPNAGGKTVAMKTVGLLNVCAQAGIHIPADSDSEIYPFKNIFVDIGDDQSIENDLSTFSSHLISLRGIVENADNQSLVLIDEIGAGTDPSEGCALSAVILQTLTERKCLTIATTHHGALKAFAHETEGMINASMEFDQNTLSPTYHFKSGIPGSSYAFELAERLGISRLILDKARAIVGSDKAKLEHLLQELESQSQEYKKQLRDTQKEKEKLQSSVLSYEQKMVQLKRELGTIRKKAVEEAKDIVLQAQKKAEHSVKEIRESAGDKEIVRSSKQVLKKLSEELHNITTQDADTEPVKHDEVICKGDTVKIKDGKELGEVVEIQKQHAVVVCNNMKMRIALNDLCKVNVKQSGYKESFYASNSADLKNEIDIRGMMGDEGVATVQNFLDKAYSAGLHRVDIIHGKGTGALRKHINAFLKTYPHIKSTRYGEWNEGGMGVTIVELE